MIAVAENLLQQLHGRSPPTEGKTHHMGSPDALLHADEQLLETLEDAAYWRKVCPGLHVSEPEAFISAAADDDELRRARRPTRERQRKELAHSGFFHFDAGASDAAIARLAAGVAQLLLHGWPASFIFVYDEAWAVIRDTAGSLEAASGGSRFLGDVFAWHVDPAQPQRGTGWSPHRDRMGSGADSFRADGTPMLSTTWLALADAHPGNSCLYVVPATVDPYYREQDDPEVDPLAAIFAGNPGAYQSIRALPCKRGCAWHFSHKLIHWGSRVEPANRGEPAEGAECDGGGVGAVGKAKAKSAAVDVVAAPPAVAPRIAMSWVVGDDSFEKPAFSRDALPFPPVALRAALVAGQMISYGGQLQLRGGFRKMCYRLFKKNSVLFTDFYRDKVDYIHLCRPAPPPVVHVKRRPRPEGPIVLEQATPEDDSKLQGLEAMFGASDSDSD